MSLVKIDQIVRELCYLAEDPQFLYYDRFLSAAIDAVRELNMYAVPVLSVQEMDLSPTKTFKWPKDCIKPAVVGLTRKDKTCNLWVDRSPAFEDKKCSVTEAEEDMDQCFSGCGDEYKVGGYRGIGKGYIGIVKHDEIKRESHVICKLEKNDKIKLAYYADGVSSGVEEVPGEYKVVIEQFCIWKFWMISKPTISDRARAMYESEFRRARKFKNNTTIEEWIEAINP